MESERPTNSQIKTLQGLSLFQRNFLASGSHISTSLQPSVTRRVITKGRCRLATGRTEIVVPW